MWGSNRSMDGMRSNRKRNGTEDIWGDPGVRKLNSSFKTISTIVMKSIYNFSYDFLKMLKSFEKIDEALDYEEDDKEPYPNNTQPLPKKSGLSNDTITYRLEARNIETRTNKYFNGFTKDIIGYQKAKKDSAYHVNRSDSTIRVKVIINKKH